LTTPKKIRIVLLDKRNENIKDGITAAAEHHGVFHAYEGGWKKQIERK
jgi:hypothetical protein